MNGVVGISSVSLQYLLFLLDKLPKTERSVVTLLLLLVVIECKVVVISNVKPRVDNQGNIMDAHDGSIQQFPSMNDGLFYYHAVQYGLCKEPGKSFLTTPIKRRLVKPKSIWQPTTDVTKQKTIADSD